MSVQEHTSSAATTPTSERSVYQSLFDKINLSPVASLKNVDAWQSDEALSDAAPAERVTAAIQVLVSCLADAAQPLERLDKTLLDEQIARLDKQISDQVNEVMHHAEFQKQESLWRGLHSMISGIDFRRNVRVEMMDVSKDALRDDFDDAPELIQSGLYRHVYIEEYDQPGGEPIAAMISAYEFDNSPQDIALLRNISGVSAACHMPFIGSVGPKFFLKENMEEVAAIKDINDYFERAEYIKWKAFRDSDDSRYIGLTMPRVLGRLPYGPDTIPVRSFNYVEEVKGPDHEKYLWTSASFSFAVNMVKSFIKNGWCVQIRGPQAGGAVKDLPIHLYDLGTGNQVKIPSEVMIPETREFEFANLGFIPLSYYKNRDYACFFSANSAQKPAQFDTPEATANSRINSRLPYIFLLSRIAHYLKILQRENIGTTKDRRLLELELNNWLRSLVTPTFQHQDTLVQSAPVVSLTAEQIDNAARHFQAVFTTLRWRVPLYLWSLYGAQFVREDDTEQEIPPIIKCGDVFRVSQCHCQQRVFGERVIVVEMPEQGSRFVPETGKQVDIIDGAKDFIAEGFQRGGGQIEKRDTGGGSELEHGFLLILLIFNEIIYFPCCYHYGD